MKRLILAATAIATVLGAAGAASAQPYHGWGHGRDRAYHNDHHPNWRMGHRMDRDDWRRGHRIDYRRYHLRAPPRGYEWREVDGDYVLAAVATGLIASIIANSH